MIIHQAIYLGQKKVKRTERVGKTVWYLVFILIYFKISIVSRHGGQNLIMYRKP